MTKPAPAGIGANPQAGSKTTSQAPIPGPSIVASTDRPELQSIVLNVPDAGLNISNFVSYEYSSHFLTAADRWSFVIEDDQRIDEIQNTVVPGAFVTLLINGKPQASGFVDSPDVSNSRKRGTTLSVSGRDLLAQVVDSNADPTLQFNLGQTLQTVVQTILSRFGMPSIVDDNVANRSLQTGTTYSTPVVKTGRNAGTALKKPLAHQLQPYPREGAFAFISRVAQRFGVWTWLAADGQTVVVGLPDFTQPPTYNLIRLRNGVTDPITGARMNTNNILDGGIRRDMSGQPDLVVAEGFSGGAQWGHSQMKVMAVNPLTGLDQNGFPYDIVTDAMSRFPDARLIQWPTFPASTRILKRELLPASRQPALRIMYLNDDEAKNPGELESFVRRELSLKLRNAVVGNYVVEGHTQNGVPWAVDTIVNVQDDESQFEGLMWVAGRSFTKSRKDGTHTHLQLFLPNVLSF